MKKTLTVAGCMLVLLVCLLGYGYYWAFYDIQRLEGQEVIVESVSPDGNYTVTAYLTNGGATTSYGVLCSVKTKDRNKEKNIYWQYRCEEAEMIWIDEETVQINGVELNVKTDTYDWRHN